MIVRAEPIHVGRALRLALGIGEAGTVRDIVEHESAVRGVDHVGQSGYRIDQVHLETEVEEKRQTTIVTETINFVPEVGETTLRATNHVIQSLAKQIVDMMEQPWSNDNDLH